LERSPSSILREIRRNSLFKIYAPETARLAAEKRARKARNANKTISAEICLYLVEKFIIISISKVSLNVISAERLFLIMMMNQLINLAVTTMTAI